MATTTELLGARIVRDKFSRRDFAVRTVELFEIGGAYADLEEVQPHGDGRECVRNAADVEVVA